MGEAIITRRGGVGGVSALKRASGTATTQHWSSSTSTLTFSITDLDFTPVAVIVPGTSSGSFNAGVSIISEGRKYDEYYSASYGSYLVQSSGNTSFGASFGDNSVTVYCGYSSRPSTVDYIVYGF